MNLKLFCIYHKKATLWKSDCIEPIQSGCAESATDLKILRDDTGDNISHKNTHYGELSVWYWVWKNFLPHNPSIDYIGFCHYRRFLSFYKNNYESPWNPVCLSAFKKRFAAQYNKKSITSYLNADVIVSQRMVFDSSIREQFYAAHGKNDFDLFESIVKKNYPQYAHIIDDTLNKNYVFFCLNYVIKKHLFEKFMEWLFPLLEELENMTHWENYTSYNTIRMPAYLTERFFCVWLNIVTSEQNITIKELPGTILCKDESLTIKLFKAFFFFLPRKKWRYVYEKLSPFLFFLTKKQRRVLYEKLKSKPL